MKYFALCAAVLLQAACHTTTPPAPAELTVIYNPHIGNAPLLTAARKERAEVLYRNDIPNSMAVQLPKANPSAVGRLHKVEGVIRIEPAAKP